MSINNPMDTHRVLCIAVFMVLWCSVSHAQQVVDTLTFDEITITATRIQQPLNHQPTNIELIDSARISLMGNQNIGQLLSSSSSLFIKNNGPGSFSNASQRGLSSEQVQVLWEGIPINNVMLGQNDLSLLSSNFFSSVQVSSGTPSTAFGGGSLSGAIYLSSDRDGASQLSLQQSVGSYGQWQTSFQGQYQANDWNVSVRSLIDHAENDYRYYNRAYDREENRSHNRREKESVMATVGHEGSKDSWKSTIWLTDSNNQIPGTILSNNEARQEDQSLRWLSSYQRQWRGGEISVKNYLDRVELNYFDRAANTESYSAYRRWMMSADVALPASEQLLWKGEISTALTGAETNNYDANQSRRQVSVLANPEIIVLDEQFRIYPALRLDSYNVFGTIISPSLGLNFEAVSKLLYLRGQLSRDFNPPTFNALYWGEGGNPDLKAERSNSAETGFTLTPNQATFSSIKLTGFYSLVDNGIRWYPGANGTYSPANIEQIKTRGIEGQLKNHLNLSGNINIKLKQQASFTRTEISEPRFSGDNVVGYQMRYVPKWKYNASLSLQKGFATGLVQYRWTGRRYITDTEELNNSLDPYQVIDATLQFQQEYKDFHFTARASVKNLFNENYEVVQWYPMPQRNLTFSLTATYQL